MLDSNGHPLDDLTSLIPGPPVSASTLDRYADTVPDVLLSTWRDHGLATTAGGFVRFVEPDSLIDLVTDTTEGFEGAVPIFTTALGDIGILHDERIEVLKYRHGRVGILPVDPDEVFTILSSRTAREHADYLDWTPYSEAIERLGVPTTGDCFGFTALLVLGGPETPDHLEIVSLREHILLITQFAGPLR